MSPSGIRLYGLARRVISKNMNGEDARIASMRLALDKGREERLLSRCDRLPVARGFGG